ncbi:MAG TPA: hypothetical protein VGP62_27130 [Bryobacteraceae bacterium]|nr:hypothetical protein [Bryobacteraceae bacterium]
MGKPKKGGFPAMEPITHDVIIRNNEIDNVIIAWGDSLVWINKDNVEHSLAALDSNGNPDPTKPWGPPMGPVGSDTANSPEFAFQWMQPTPPPKDPQIYRYGLLDHPTSKATVTVQIKV